MTPPSTPPRPVAVDQGVTHLPEPVSHTERLNVLANGSAAHVAFVVQVGFPEHELSNEA